MKKLKVFLLFKLLLILPTISIAADNMYLYDCVYKSSPLVIYCLKDGK